MVKTDVTAVKGDPLSARDKIILYSVVHEYVLTAEPVGSETLVHKYGLGVSPATVRHALVGLTELGYLAQPHTSAGRVPTDHGYRYYVDSLMKAHNLSSGEQRSIHSFYAALNREMEVLLKSTSEVLARMTHYMSVVFAPPVASSSIKHLDLVALSARRLLLVLITDTGRVLKKTMEVATPTTAGQIGRVEGFLNDRLFGGDLESIKVRRAKVVAECLPADGPLADHVISNIIDWLAEERRESVFVGGTSEILRQPEFENIHRVQQLLGVLEEGCVYLNVLGSALESTSVIVRIGSENADLPDGCSLVAGHYEVAGRPLGALGLIGPTRMNYGQAISAVDFVSKNLGKVLESLNE